MAKLIFEGLTLEQAKCFAYWFEHQGEGDMCSWFMMDQIKVPKVVYKDNWLEINGENVIVYCKE